MRISQISAASSKRCALQLFCFFRFLESDFSRLLESDFSRLLESDWSSQSECVTVLSLSQIAEQTYFIRITTRSKLHQTLRRSSQRSPLLNNQHADNAVFFDTWLQPVFAWRRYVICDVYTTSPAASLHTFFNVR